MSQQPDKQEPARPAARGEAAWRQSKESIAERNEQVRKAGMQQRKAEERRKHDLRRAAEVREGVALQEQFGGR